MTENGIHRRSAQALLVLFAIVLSTAAMAQVMVNVGGPPLVGSPGGNSYPMNYVNGSFLHVWPSAQIVNGTTPIDGDITEFGWQYSVGFTTKTWPNVKFWFGETTNLSGTMNPTFMANFNTAQTPVLAYDGPMTITGYSALAFMRVAMQNTYFYTRTGNLAIYVEIVGGSSSPSTTLASYSSTSNLNARIFNATAVSTTGTVGNNYGHGASFQFLQQINGEHTEMKEVSIAAPGGRPVMGNNIVQARIRNNGTVDKSTHTIPMEYRINGGAWVPEVFPAAPFPGLAQRTLQFVQPWVVTAGGTYSVEVRLNPAVGQGLATMSQSYQVYENPNIVPQFTDGFNFATALDQYTVIKGSLADAQIKAAAAQNGTSGARLMGTQSTGLFTPVDLTNAAHRAVLDNPAQWDGGGAVDPSPFVGSMVLTTLASGVQNLNVSFAYRIVQTGTTPGTFAPYQANLIFQHSTDNVNWTTAIGPTANQTTGIYRTTATTTTPTFTNEAFTLSGFPGTLGQQLYFRFRWLCRLKDDTSSVQTFIDIDNFQLTVPFTITTLSLPEATGTVPYEYEHGPVSVQQISGAAPVTFSVAPPPAWMTLNPSTGLITGMPPASAAGTTNLTFSANDSAAATATRIIPFTVKPAPSAVAITNLATLPEASENIEYIYNLSAFGGAPIQFGTNNPRYFWSITTDATSSWLSVNPNTGRLTGTPPLGSFGTTARFTARVKDGLRDLAAGTMANEATKEFFIHIVEQLTVMNPTLELAREGNTYRPNFGAAGGTAPYTWAIAAGALPAGLTFQPETGLIIGVPLIGATGTYNLTLQVFDAGVQSVQFTTALVVAAAQASDNLTITTTDLSPNTVVETQPFEAYLDAIEGVPPYTWSVPVTSPDQLPAGLALDQNGRIFGNPFAGTARPYTITFLITDSASPTPQTHTATLSLEVVGQVSPPSILTNTLQTAEVGQAYPPSLPFPPLNTNAPGLRVSGGSAPFSWQLVNGVLPSGMTFSPIGLITGIPLKDAELNSPYNLTVRVTDALGNTDERNLILDVLPFSGTPISILGTTPPASTETAPYSFRLTAAGGANPTGSTLPYVFRKVTGQLPSGMDMDPFGQLRGTPIVGSAGAYPLVIEAQDAAGFTAQSTVTLNVIAVSGGGGGGSGAVTPPVPLIGTGSGCSLTSTSGSGNSSAFAVLGLLSMAAVGAGVARRRRKMAA